MGNRVNSGMIMGAGQEINSDTNLSSYNPKRDTLQLPEGINLHEEQQDLRKHSRAELHKQ